MVRRSGDDPSIFAIELETLARMASMDIDFKIQLQIVRDCFIDGQADCALRRHLDSLGPNTPMTEMVDSCRIWEDTVKQKFSHRQAQTGALCVVTCQVTEVEPTPAVSPETGPPKTWIKNFSDTGTATSAGGPNMFGPGPLIQQLMETICQPTPVAQERSPASDLEKRCY